MKSQTIITLVILSAIGAAAATAFQNPGVPAKYAGLYQRYENGLNAIENYLDRPGPKAGGPITFGAELLPANANVGPGLFAPQNLDTAAKMLDRFKELGLTGVTVNIGYPVLTDDIPRAADYIAFYKKIAGLVRERGLRLCLKLHVAFAGTVFSRVPVDFSGMTIDKLTRGKRLMAERALREMGPDYLALVGEPDTEAKLSGLSGLDNPATYASLVRAVLKDLPKGKTLVGAGQGTWSPAAFAEAYAKTDVDFINIHIYPLGRRVLANIERICAAARRNNKKILLDECWLYKTDVGEGGGPAASANIYRRDNYGFWQPLDRRFLEAMAKLAVKEGVEYVSPFWSHLFFSYIDYDPGDEALPYTMIQQKVNRTAYQDVRDGIFSDTGKFYGELIKKYGRRLTKPGGI
jgi:hypothetical protein